MHWLGFLPWWIWVPYLVLWLYVMVTLIMENREPADTLAWAFAFLLVPVLGIIFYFIAGRDWATITEKKQWMRDYYAQLQAALKPFFERNAAADARFRQQFGGTYVERLSDTMSREDGLGVVSADQAEIFPTGAEKFSRLRVDLAAAQRFIHIQYFIWEDDELTDALTEILRDRVQAGVRGALPLRLPGQQALEQGQARGTRAAGREGGEGRRLDLPSELPRPPQDRRHRRRDRLHRRLQRGPGVRRRRRAFRRLARHARARHRPGRGRAGGAVRGALVRPDQGGRLHRRVSPGPAGRRRRRVRHPLPGHRAVRRGPVEVVTARPHAGGGQCRQAGVDPVALLHPRGRALRHDDQRRALRRRRALHDDRRTGQEGARSGPPGRTSGRCSRRASRSTSTRPASCTQRR